MFEQKQISNDEYQKMRALEIKRLEYWYDLNTVEGIMRIPVPCWEPNHDSPTGRVEYYLRGQCFNKHKKNGRNDLALACLLKAQELMYISDMIWKYDDFMRLVVFLHKIGRHEDAKREHRRLDQFFDDRGLYPKLKRRDFETRKNYLSWKETVSALEREHIRKQGIYKEYFWLQEHFPDICPKSMSSYSRMKTQNTVGYRKIMAAVGELKNNPIK